MNCFSNLPAWALCASLTLAMMPLAHAGQCNGYLTIMTESNPDSAYIITWPDDGTVTDSRTGLMWQRCTIGQTWANGTCNSATDANGLQIGKVFDWDAALQLAQDSYFAGYTDWRLPNVKELQSLVEHCRSTPAINTTVFPNTPTAWYWSSSPYLDPLYNRNFSWGVDFDAGLNSSAHRRSMAYVRLVRNGDAKNILNAATIAATNNNNPLSISATGSGAVTYSGNGGGASATSKSCISSTSSTPQLSGTCTKNFTWGETVTLNVAPANFKAWGGACGATTAATCKVTMLTAQNVSVVFMGNTTAPITPVVPVLDTLTATDTTITIPFTQDLSNNGIAGTSFHADCVKTGEAAKTQSGTASPITVSGLTPDSTYSCTVTATKDGISSAPSVAKEKKTIDTIAPVITSYYPSNQSTGAPTNGNIVLTFSENIAKGTGNIILTPSTGTPLTYAVATSTNLTFSGNTLTIDPTDDLQSNTLYIVIIPTASVKDMGGNLFSGATYSFITLTPDITAPTATSFDPADKATSVAIDKTITLTFSEPIARGTGSIVLQPDTGEQLTYDVATNSTNLVFSVNTLTINPTGNLANGMRYTVTIPATSVKDTAGNSFEATYSFTTTAAPVPPPTPVDDGKAPALVSASGTGTDPARISIVFSKDIVQGQGSIVWKSGNTEIGRCNQANACPGVVWYSGNTIFIDPETPLALNTSYTVVLSKGAVIDTSESARPNEAATYTFTLTDANSGGQTIPINGTSGNDTLTDLKGDNTIDGGAGIDTAVFTGNLTNYTVAKSGSSYTVTDTRSGGYGTNTVTNIELLKFDDKTVNLTIQAKAAATPQADVTRLVELYVAFFNRVPDADGLAYWIDQFKGGQSMAQIADSFYAAGVAKPDLTGFSASMTDAEFVKVIYKNVLGRSGTTAPLDADVAYWANNLAIKVDTRGSLINTILGAAHGYKGDATWGWVPNLLDNKIAVAKTFAIDWGLNYPTADQNITEGMKIAAAVTATDTAAALALIGAYTGRLSLQ